MYWSDVTKEIKEVASDYEVELQSSISFFKEGENRNLFLDVIEESKVRPSSFDLNFQIVTAKGNERCLRVISKSEFNGNECTRIYGIFQDITERKNIENKLQKSYDEIRMLSNHILSVREEERLHIAREIHDELGQQLTVLKMDVLAISKQSNYLPLPVISKIDRMIQMIDKSIQTVKKIVTELRPGILDDLGLIAALEWQAKEFQNSTGIFCRFNSNCIVENYSDKINTAVFRIFQESLTNVARHSKATKVFTQLYNHNNMLVLEVNDNGIGMCTESINSSSSFGVLGMKERATMLNGYINIQPSPTGGTRVQVQIPIQ
jgi:signal transduction histidine kinase